MVGERKFTPFADGETSLGLHGLTFENGTAALAVYGNATFTRDAAGRAALAEVVAVLLEAQAVLAAEDLPERTAGPDEVQVVGNPFD